MFLKLYAKFCSLESKYNSIGIGVQTFSFVINKAIGHCSDFAANYLDDIIVFSRTAEEHMLHLEAIFEALQIADLKVLSIKM